MKYLLGFIIALILSIILRPTNLDPFLAGWFSCMGWFITVFLYDKNKDNI